MKSAKAVRLQTAELDTLPVSDHPSTPENFFHSAIPKEALLMGSGCGHPARFLRPGETVLELGSGGGKTSFIAAQVVGQTGRVLGIENNVHRLAVAKQSIAAFSRAVGFRNVEFRKGKAEDLRMNVEKLEKQLSEQPVQGPAELEKFEEYVRAERMRDPLVRDNSVDVVITNHLLTALTPWEKERAIAEIKRVLKTSGRAVLSEYVALSTITAAQAKSEEFKNAGLVGAVDEATWVTELKKAGFKFVWTLDSGAAQTTKVVDGVTFRALIFAVAMIPLEEYGRRISRG